ncbi:MAG TPA: peptidase MA family metallohydrolase [Patescibacteria group bacterium]|nr:peptidase MA family metallohydrolase [Patescibacteria group bacterium]
MRNVQAAVKNSILLITACWCGIASGESSPRWEKDSGTHFVVYYQNADARFVEAVLEKAEDYYTQITDALGFKRRKFWLGSERAKIYIYDTAQDYRQATDQPGWSAGCAWPLVKTIHTFPYASGFFETVLPHEMAHIIFREFVGLHNSAVPSWLEEGVASYQEVNRADSVTPAVRKLVDDGSFVSLVELDRLNPAVIPDAKLVNIFYMEAVGVVDFLVKKYGPDDFVDFCEKLEDTQDLERALWGVYRFKGVDELDRKWQRYLKE